MAECAAVARGGAGGDRQTVLRAVVAGMANGSESAASELYDQTSNTLYALALRITANTHDAEEVLHDAYCRAWRTAKSYDETRGSVMAWLVLMTRSLAIDLVRSKARPSVIVPAPAHMDAESPEISPEAQAGAHQAAERVRIALAALPAEQRESIELAFFGGLTHVELAEQLEVPLGTIKSRIRAGLGRLRGLLEDFGA